MSTSNTPINSGITLRTGGAYISPPTILSTGAIPNDGAAKALTTTRNVA